MNHQRFGWRGDERSDRYPRGDSGSERFRGDGREQYGPNEWRGSERWRGNEGYEDMERPGTYGRWSSNPREDYGGEYGGDMGYGYGRHRMGGSYGGGMDWNEQERDRYGRFTSGRQQRMGGSYGGWNEPERDQYGRFTGGGEGRGWNAREQERDDMGRFTSQGSRGYGQNFGPHTGRGPKNYQRSEERIREDVCDRLEEDGDIDANEIDVKVSNGTVTLTGTVESRHEKRMAEQIAEDAPGVKDVQNQLRVSGKKSEQGSSTQQTGSHPSGQQARKTA